MPFLLPLPRQCICNENTQTISPTGIPTAIPTEDISNSPTVSPSYIPTSLPSLEPTPGADNKSEFTTTSSPNTGIDIGNDNDGSKICSYVGDTCNQSTDCCSGRCLGGYCIRAISGLAAPANCARE